MWEAGALLESRLITLNPSLENRGRLPERLDVPTARLEPTVGYLDHSLGVRTSEKCKLGTPRPAQQETLCLHPVNHPHDV